MGLEVPFDLVPILLDLNSKERNLLHQYMSKNKRERSVLFDSTSENNFLTQKETNSYYILNTELLSASRIKSVLINTYEKITVDLPINLMYEEKKLGTLNSPIGKPTVNIEKLNCLIYTKDNQLCLDIEAFGSLDEKERLKCSYYIKIPFKYVPEILDMNQREKDIFNSLAKV